jgi:hypothetical protein
LTNCLAEPWGQFRQHPWRPSNSPTPFYQLGKQKKLDIKKAAPREAWAGNISTYSVNDIHFFELMQIGAKVKGERIVTYLAEMSYVGYNFLKSETTSAK